MHILAIDSSGHTACVSILNNEKILIELNQNTGYTHSGTLMPLVAKAFSCLGMDPREMDYIACSMGPGSFTGLRIGAAAAKGLASGLGKKIVGVSTLDTLAYNIHNTNAHIIPVMDARRNEVYTAAYTWSPKLTRISEYMALDIAELAELAKSFDTNAVFVGDGLVYRDQIKELCGDIAQFAPLGHSLQRGAAIGALALEMIKNGAAAMPHDFNLLYIRRPQAERELEAKINLADQLRNGAS